MKGYTSAQLLKAVAAGIEVRITIAGEPTGGAVVYRPTHKGDRFPWVYTAVQGTISHEHRYQARDCAPVRPVPVIRRNAIRSGNNLMW